MIAQQVRPVLSLFQQELKSTDPLPRYPSQIQRLNPTLIMLYDDDAELRQARRRVPGGLIGRAVVRCFIDRYSCHNARYVCSSARVRSNRSMWPRETIPAR
jgi:hypothetical protein